MIDGTKQSNPPRKITRARESISERILTVESLEQCKPLKVFFFFFFLP